MVACFRPSLSWTYVIELVFMNHDKTLAVKGLQLQYWMYAATGKPNMKWGA